MSGVGVSAAWVLAAVFAAAAAGKLRHVEDTWSRFAALRLPAPRLLTVGVPAVELLCAGLLLVRPRAGGAVALVLLAAFSWWLAGAIRAGAPVGCGCFGSRRSAAPLSPVELVRNALLGLAAALALAAPRPLAPDVPAVLAVGTGAATAAVVIALAELRRDVGQVWANAAEVES